MRLKAFLKRHILWVGFLSVILPLLTILGLQYRSLVDLQKASAAAQRGLLKNYLEAVAKEVEYFYRTDTERALNVSSLAFTQDNFHKIPYCFKEAKGAKLLFVAFLEQGISQILFYHPSATCSRMPSPPEPTQLRAVKVALSPWKLLSLKDTPVESTNLTVDERDPENRLILKPVTDELSKVVGITGMIVDPVFFKERYLPKVIQEYLRKFFPDKEQENVIVTVHDGNNQPVLTTQAIQGQNDAVWMSFPFIFTDWRLSIQSRYLTPEQWAQRHFAINLSLSILMTIVLIGGIVLALQTASRAMRLSQMKTDFVSNVSHELRTPLSSIRVFGEFLRLGWVLEPEKIREYGAYIETESRRLTQLINNILDFSKIESGQKTYQFEKTDILEVVTETLKIFEIRLKHSGFSIMLESPPSPLPQVIIDPDAMAQALTNLLDNAVKYSGEAKEIVVRVGEQKGYITIAVTDRGIGIPLGEQKKIFERFHRVSTGLVHDVKGSGLGLSIVKHIVEAHYGKVTLESTPGKGSTFTIHLPIRE